MFTVIRKHQRKFLLVVAVATVVAFVVLYNQQELEAAASGGVATAYGKKLTQYDLEREARNYTLALNLGLFDFVRVLTGEARSEDDATLEFVMNLLVVRHQAGALGIQPTDEEVLEKIKANPVFATNGQFDSRKYAAFVQEQLAPRGFTERQLESLMRDALRLESLQDLVDSPVAVSDAELRDAFQGFQAIKATIIHFDGQRYEEGIQASDEEIQKFFEGNASRLQTPEYRSVRFVELALPAEQQSLTGKERLEAMQKLADQATALTAQIAEGKTFSQAAEDAGLKVQTSSSFDRNGESPVATQIGGATAAEQLALYRRFASPTFRLTESNRVSEILEEGQKFYLLELLETTPSRPLTLEEAKPDIEQALIRQQAVRKMREAAEKAVPELAAAAQNGQSVAAAAEQAGLRVEALDNVVVYSDLPPEQRYLAEATISLEPGQFSGFKDAPWGGFVAYLAERAPVNEAEFTARKAETQEQLLIAKRTILFLEWLRSSREAANIRFNSRG